MAEEKAYTVHTKLQYVPSSGMWRCTVWSHVDGSYPAVSEAKLPDIAREQALTYFGQQDLIRPELPEIVTDFTDTQDYCECCGAPVIDGRYTYEDY